MIKSRRYYFVWCAAATFLLVGSLTFAFKPRIHAAITNVGLAGVVTGPKTLNALVVNNMKTDAPPHFFLAKNHFDEESFLAGS